MKLLVDSANGIYSWNRLVNNYPLFINCNRFDPDGETINGINYSRFDWFLSDSDWFEGDTIETVFHPDNYGWCESVDYCESLGLFVKSNDGQYWSVYQGESGDIFAVPPGYDWESEL